MLVVYDLVIPFLKSYIALGVNTKYAGIFEWLPLNSSQGRCLTSVAFGPMSDKSGKSFCFAVLPGLSIGFSGL